MNRIQRLVRVLADRYVMFRFFMWMFVAGAGGSVVFAVQTALADFWAHSAFFVLMAVIYVGTAGLLRIAANAIRPND